MIRQWLACLLLFQILLCGYAAAGDGLYPRLSQATLYEGTAETRAATYTAELYLLEKQLFILHLAIKFKRGNVRTQDITGTWRQTGGGATLRLVNRHGLMLDLNVGGTGNLYGEVPFGGQIDQKSVVLKKTPFRRQEACLMGTLTRRGSNITLKESATGREFAATLDGLPTTLPEKTPVFADVVAVPVAGGMRLLHIRSFSQTFPTEAAASTQGDTFVSAVAERIWTLAAMQDMPLSSWRFTGGNTGTLEIAGPGLRAEAHYTVNGKKLTIELNPKNARNLRACGAAALEALLHHIAVWSLESKELCLSTVDGQSLQLQPGAAAQR
ncbi:MAG: hypothetical protein IJU65_07090 [Desulfovibrio sp.]|nr:hypothetical protein [Desulfovibrio sp.]